MMRKQTDDEWYRKCVITNPLFILALQSGEFEKGNTTSCLNKQRINKQQHSTWLNAWRRFKRATPPFVEKLEMGNRQHGGWLRSHDEAPTCETFPRLCEKPSCASSSLSRLRKLAPHVYFFTHIVPFPFLGDWGLGAPEVEIKGFLKRKVLGNMVAHTVI